MATVVITLANGFGEREFSTVRCRLEQAGHRTVLAGVGPGEQVSSNGGRVTVTVDARPGDLATDGFDALLIPGGPATCQLRQDRDLVEFVKSFVATGKPVAAICSGLRLLAAAGAVSGRTLTSERSIRTDLQDAGAAWIDATVVLDGNLVTSRSTDDLPLFCDALLGRINEQHHPVPS